MTYRIVATNSFERDYDRIVAYIAHELDAPQAALSLMNEVESAALRIAENPLIRAISQKPVLAKSNYREYFIKNYTILYKIEKDIVIFGRMHHQTRNYGSNVFPLP